MREFCQRARRTPEFSSEVGGRVAAGVGARGGGSRSVFVSRADLEIVSQYLFHFKKECSYMCFWLKWAGWWG